MRIVDNKAVLLKLRNPKKVTAVIPHSKELPNNKVLVKWGLDETQYLRNLNINVPSPIRGRYNWPGKFTPYQHQIDTSEFLTLHRRAFCFNEMGCVDSETEYLSPTGWKKISDYSGGKVAQFHPETGEAEYVQPDEYVKLPCETMVRFTSKYGIDQMLSPEHRVLHYKADRQSGEDDLFWRVDNALSLHNKLHSRDISQVLFKTTYKADCGSGVALSDDELRLQIAVIADGYFGSRSTYCVVRLKKERKILRMKELLQKAGVEYTELVPEYESAEGFHIFKFYAPLRKKKFDAYFWECTDKQLALVADEVVHWDGAQRKSDGVAFYSTEKESADFVQHAFVSTGRVARITDDSRGCYQVYVRSKARLVGITNKYGPPASELVASTDGFKYCFMVPSTFLVFRRNGCVFTSGNTGKTSSAIWAADYLMSQNIIKRVLVVAPLSIMDSAWRSDLFNCAMHRKVDIAYGSADKRRKVIKSDAEFVIINFDGLNIVEKEVAEGGFDLFIVDEASSYKNPQTKRWKTLNRLVGPETWLWMMTGTPAAQSPLDAYGLAKLVNPSSVPRFMGSFRDMVMKKVTTFKWVPKPDATETVHRVLQPAIRFTTEECLDLPDLTYVKRDVEMSTQQRKYYNELKKEMLIRADGEEVTAPNAAIVMNKLLQIASGCAYSDNKEVLEFDITKRYNVLKEVVNETSQKVLVFAPFKHVIDLLMEMLRADGLSTEMIRGDVSAGKRTEIFKRFQEEPDPKILVIQPQAAAHGVTLTAANTVVWWGPTSSLEIYSQANARVYRSGQKHPCTVVQLQGSDVEKHVYKMLDNRIDVHSKIVDLYKQILD